MAINPVKPTTQNPATRSNHTPTGHTPTDQASDETSPATLSDDQWRRRLTPDEYQVLRQAATEPPFTGEYVATDTVGSYECRACGAELFRSETKFGSHCGWPSFYTPLAEDSVTYIRDKSLGMERVEVRCANCNSHLGHVFTGEGYDTPTDQRYCINSISLRLVPTGDAAPDASDAERA